MPQPPAGFVPDGFVPDAAPSAAPRNVLLDGRSGGFDDSQPSSGIAQWFETKLRPLLEQVAHPQTISEIAGLLIPDAVPLGATVRAGARAIGATGRGVEAAAPAVQQAATAIGPAGVAGGMFHGSPGTAAAIGAGAVLAPKATAMTGRVLQRAGGALERAAAEAAPVAAPAAAAPVVDEFTAARTAKASAGLPDQKALNEAALAARRSAYQARQSGTPVAADLPPAGPVVAASGKMQLTAPEMKEFARLIKTMPLPDALEQVKALRALASMPGVATDAAAQAAIAARQYKR